MDVVNKISYIPFSKRKFKNGFPNEMVFQSGVFEWIIEWVHTIKMVLFKENSVPSWL